MAFFQSLLTSRQLGRHQGRPLWTYGLSDSEFYQLSQALSNAAHTNQLDPNDCALYYAEWWKRCYNGGIPSKRDIADSIGGQHDEERLFQLARKGGQLLGVRWIKNQNTLYFKTLLLQGGLPVRHMSANAGRYKNFLLKILELNPDAIDDFAFDSVLTAYLPPSSRNPEVYECCLSIVKAIMANDEEYLKILNDNQELSEISAELMVKKLSLRAPVRKTKIKVTWMLDTVRQAIRLYLIFPEFTAVQFCDTFLRGADPDQLDYVYKCYYNGLVVCKFIKKANGCYKTDWVNQEDLLWDGSEQLPDIYLTGADGLRHNCYDLVGYLPDLEQATLWTSYDDTQYTLEKGSHTSAETGFLLTHGDLRVTSNLRCQTLKLYAQTFELTEFSADITIADAAGERQFKASSKKIDWYILDQRPKWIKRANLPITSGKPHVVAEDENGPLKNITLRWRQSPSTVWNNWSVPAPAGLIDIRLQAGEIVEHDSYFNIASLGRNVSSENLHSATIELTNNQFHFRIYENPLTLIEKSGSHTITLNLATTSRIPHTIHGYLKLEGQTKGLQFEMEPPFHGVAMLDNQESTMEHGSSLTLNKLYGYRLMTNQDNLLVNITNSGKPNIIIAEPLERGLSSLTKLEDKIVQLYALSDVMDGDAEIRLEIVEQKHFGQTKLAEYRVKRYDQRISWTLAEDRSLLLQTQPVQPELFAVPLDCPLNELYLRDLTRNDHGYELRDTSGTTKFIVFSGKETRVQPTFICNDPAEEPTGPEERLDRIAQLRDQLLGAGPEDEIWLRLLSYFRICQQNGLTYATFDILRASSFSSALAARVFVFLAYHDESQTFIGENCNLLERDIGFCFHWATARHWFAAGEWIGCHTDPAVAEYVFGSIVKYFDELQPTASFRQIADYVIKDKKPTLKPGFHLNTEITRMRSLLGRKVLDELPTKCPKVPEAYKRIIGVNEALANVKLLLKSPITVALSIAGLDDSLWKKENEEIRRHVRYSQILDPAWYSEAINYCLTKI